MGLAGVAGPFGGGFGYAFHLFFVGADDINHEKEAKEHIFMLCLVAAIVFSAIFFVAMLLFRGKPPIPPT